MFFFTRAPFKVDRIRATTITTANIVTPTKRKIFYSSSGQSEHS